jgi:hypothetical protein
MVWKQADKLFPRPQESGEVRTLGIDRRLLVCLLCLFAAFTTGNAETSAVMNFEPAPAAASLDRIT